MARLASTYRCNKPSKSVGSGKIRRIELRTARAVAAAKQVTAEIEITATAQINRDTVLPVALDAVREARLAARRARDRAARAAKKLAA